MGHWWIGIALLAGGDDADAREKIIQAIKPLQPLVGSWRGTATPLDRESKRDRRFWREPNEWKWSLEPGKVGLVWTTPPAAKDAADAPPTDGPWAADRFVAGFLTVRADRQTYQFEVERADGARVVFAGPLTDQRLELDGPRSDGESERVTIHMVGPNRYLIQRSTRQTGKSRSVRTFEIGNTREGGTFAAGASGPECIVTGGKGTIEVTHKGQTYYVCCTGCKDAFEADPQKYIAESKSKSPAP